jgi:ABC-type transport system substrate-binding protein
MQMTFLAPVPWEADAFYAQPGMAERGLSLDTWPVGTGPYMMVEYVKDRRHVMVRNPNYRGEPYPCEGMPGDRRPACWTTAARPCPSSTRIVSTVEREAVPQRGKFRQGYYDVEVFERTDTGMDYLVAMQDSEDGAREYTDKGFRLGRAPTSTATSSASTCSTRCWATATDARAARAQPQAAPGDLDRHRLGGVLAASSPRRPATRR